MTVAQDGVCAPCSKWDTVRWPTVAFSASSFCVSPAASRSSFNRLAKSVIPITPTLTNIPEFGYTRIRVFTLPVLLDTYSPADTAPFTEFPIMAAKRPKRKKLDFYQQTVVEALSMAESACADLVLAHSPACRCPFCRNARSLHWILRVLRNQADGGFNYR
jgi:hypothetical protein